MNKINAPISPGMTGAAVTALQDTLFLCLDRRVLLAGEPAKQGLWLALTREREETAYRDATTRLVAAFQGENSLKATGAVDDATAAALNALLGRWGMLEQGGAGAAASFIVSGRVHRDDDVPLPGLLIRAAHDTGNGIVRLGQDTSDDAGRYTIRCESLPGAAAISLLVTAFDSTGTSALASARLDAPGPLEILDLAVGAAEIRPYRVGGKVASAASAGVGKLRVIIVDKGVGGDMVLAEAVTDSEGSYAASFSDSLVRQRGKTRPDLQARVFAGETFLGASRVYYDAPPSQSLHVLLDDDGASPALRSEHETLASALAAQFKGKIGDIREDVVQQDISYLANKTGWDARAVALFALADWHSAQVPASTAGPGIAPAYFYALFRAGVSASDAALYHIDRKTLEGIWKTAMDQGVVPRATDDVIRAMATTFQAISAQKLLSEPAKVGASSLKDLLSVAALDEGQQSAFARLHAAWRGDMPGFWTAVGDDPAFGATPGERSSLVSRLQLDGRLAFLTINNAPLVQKLHATAGTLALSDAVQLAQAGYHRADAWRELLGQDVPVPPEIPGDGDESRRANYAAFLAAQIRLSYPTASVAQMVKAGVVRLPGSADDAAQRLHAFLAEHQETFDIGAEPVERYLARNAVAAGGDVVGDVSRLQRVYQITPGDEAMAGLLKRGVDAAYHVVRLDRNTFVESFAADLGGADQAGVTYDRAVQVHNIVLNIALGYLHARTAPPVGVHSPAAVIDPATATSGDVIAYPTLEQLLGPIDFCACAECQSIFSPARYLVDLLLALHSDAADWTVYLGGWKSRHKGAPYPFDGPDERSAFENDWQAGHPGVPVPDTGLSPFEVLMQRRPDIQHVPLTCEHTNTELPYIDLVNHALEYHVANGLTLQQNVLPEYAGPVTDGIASDDLLASPQFGLDAAYDTLGGEYFPAPLPFDRRLESLRRYFARFELALPLVMERLRPSDALDASPYGWRDILMEEIGVSRAEYELLTDSKNVPLWRAYGFPADSTDAVVITGLSNAKRFVRRLGIGYDELVAILSTRFINPDSDLVPKLERLGMSIDTLKAFRGGTLGEAEFDKMLAALPAPPDPAEYGPGGIKAWVRNDANYERLAGLVTLAVPAAPWSASTAFAAGARVLPGYPGAPGLYFECTTAGTSAAAEPAWPALPGESCPDGTITWTCRSVADCRSLDNLALRYADPARRNQDIDALDYFRLLRFIRLWKKLGWTIDQTDAAIAALDPPLDPSQPDEVVKLDGEFRTLIPALGVVARVMRSLNLNPGRDLLPLLACWSDIGAHGPRALYRQMFLDPALLRQDNVFADNGYGQYLTAGGTFAGHEAALRSAFKLTGDEYAAIIAALGKGPDPQLTIENLSAVLRRGWLARKLKISIRELLLLLQFTGLDPFAAPDPAGPAILRLIAFVQALKQTALKPAAALYLVWNRDLSGKAAPAAVQINELARSLRADFAALDDQFRSTDDPGGDLARARLALVYGPETSDAFLALLDDSIVVDAPYTQAAPQLDAAIATADPALGYDHFRHRLSHLGLVSAALPGGATDQAFADAFKALFVRSEDLKGAFFTRHPELRPAYEQAVALDASLVLATDYSQPDDTLPAPLTAADNRISYDKDKQRLAYAGRLTVARREVLRRLAGVAPAFQAALDALFTLSQQARGAAVLAAVQPELARRRKRQQALQRLGAAVAVDLPAVTALLDPGAAPWPLHAAAAQDRPALDDVVALETAGLAVRFFFRDTATGQADISLPAVANLDYSQAGGNPLPHPGAPVSGIWSGQIEAPEAGFHNFIIETDPQAKVTLALGGQPPRTLAGSAGTWRNADPVELEAGQLYDFELEVENVQDRLTLQWETPARAREAIPARCLYPPSVFGPFATIYQRFRKAASLMKALGLGANELAFFATHPDYLIGGDGWLNALAVQGDPPATAALLKPVQALLDFTRVKAGIAPGDESLLAVLRGLLRDPAAASSDADSPLFAVTGWNKAGFDRMLVRFGANAAGLAQFDLFVRLHDAFGLVQAAGISAQALAEAATNAPTSEVVRNLQGALSARYDAADWRDVVRPISDEMRSLQRDALVACVIQKMRLQPETAHIDTPEKLNELLLIDVQTAPCAKTSRVQFALIAVHNFFERCLMKLEPRVAPETIDAQRWETMSRLSVWRAWAEVMQFPENVLDLSLRDDKSSFYKEFESELLQGDVTEERAKTAVLNYLSKLAEVAKLERCGMFYVAPDPDTHRAGITHIVARTTGAGRKFFCQRREGSFVTPLEQVKLEIEDIPVVPLVWNELPFLFWLRVVKKGTGDVASPFSDSNKPVGQLDTSTLKAEEPEVRIEVILCWSKYFNGKWQPTRTSDQSFLLTTSQPQRFERSKVKLTIAALSDDELTLVVQSFEPPGEFVLLLVNPETEPEILPQSGAYLTPDPTLETIDRFTVSYNGTGVTDTLFQYASDGNAVQPVHPFAGQSWELPFFYQDRRHVFHVETSAQPVPVPLWHGFAVDKVPGMANAIPGLVMRPSRIVPEPVRPVRQQPGLAVSEPLPVQGFVAGDAYIHRAIGSAGTVRYGDVEIGPAGSQASSIRTR